MSPPTGSDLLAALDGPRAIVLDAAVGTRLIPLGLVLDRDDAVLWNLSRPDLIRDLHARDVDAGADAVIANTFGASRPRLDRFGRASRLSEIVRAAVRLARQAAGPSRVVLGSIGPYPSILDAPSAYRETAECLADEGVDGLLIETHSFDQARTALGAIRGTGPPLLVTLFALPDRPGIAAELAEAGASAVGLNCTIGLDVLLAGLASLRDSPIPLIARPGTTASGEGPDAFGEAAGRLIALGVKMIGGCCGTDERYVNAIRRAVDGV